MKKTALIIVLLLLAVTASYADKYCDDALREAKQLFNQGNYKKAKSLFEYVSGECGASYGDASSWIEQCNEKLKPKPAATTLSLSQTSVSATAAGTTQTIIVTSNKNWSIDYPSGTMYSVSRNGDRLTVTINQNYGTTSRTDFFNVKTSDGKKSQRVNLSQSANSSTSSNYSGSRVGTATIHKAWIEHNVYRGNVKGMNVHVKFDVTNSLNHVVRVCAYMYDENYNAVYSSYASSGYKTSDGHVSASTTSTAKYENTTWNDFVLFFPYNEFHLQTNGQYVTLNVKVAIYDDTSSQWYNGTNSYKWVSMSYSN